MKPKRQYNQQPNIITRSSDNMSLIEKRLMYIVINRLDTGFDIQPDLFKNMEFKIPFSKLGDTNYDRISKAVKKLQFRALTLIDDDKKEEYESIIPFPHVKIKGSVVTLTMMSNVMPYFLELKRGFTKYELSAALTLTSIYSQKLYELLSRWKDKKKWSVPLSELQKLLNASNYKYKDFRVRCLDKGINELNEKTDLFVSYETEKEGKSVTDIHFEISSKQSEEHNQAKETVSEEMDAISALTPGQIAVYMNKLLNDYTFTAKQRDSIMSNTKLMEQFADLESKIANGVIKNVLNRTAYIASVLFKEKTAKGKNYNKY